MGKCAARVAYLNERTANRERNCVAYKAEARRYELSAIKQEIADMHADLNALEMKLERLNGKDLEDTP